MISYARQKGLYSAHIEGMHFHLYKNQGEISKGPLLLLHGIRLGGIQTWEPIIKQLKGWSEILVPDLPGVGLLNPHNKTDHDFDLKILVHSLSHLVEQHGWSTFDIAGYSYGGFLSMLLASHLDHKITRHFIIESALLVDGVDRLHLAGTNLNNIANLMQTDPDLGNEYFSELVSNKNTRQFQIASNRRPIYNYLGFANLIKLLTSVYQAPIESLWSIIKDQKSVTMLLAAPLSTEKQNMLMDISRYVNWNTLFLDNSDHSLVFTAPDRIANFLNEQWNL